MIRLAGIHRVFDVGDQHVHALDGVDLTIEAGEYVSLMGPSGSGKSTLLNLIGLLDRPTQGSYYLAGRDTATLSDAELARTRSEQIGFIFQFFHLIGRLTALENVALPMVLAGHGRRERLARAQAVLADVGLSDRAHHRPDQLSGGQRQRVAIARAIVMSPHVLLADEPTGNLDSHSGGEVVEILEGLNREGLTLIVVTHDAGVGNRAGRRLQMIDGRIAQDSARARG